NVEWGVENRTAGLRVPDSTPQNMRLENRLPGADANPYIAIAASLMCGYLGMVKRIAPSAPVQGRAYERRNLRLPFSLESALERMEQCRDVPEEMRKNFFRAYHAVKRVNNKNYKRLSRSREKEFHFITV